MLIWQGKVETLAGHPWAAIEIVSELGSYSERRTEEIVLHIIRWTRKHLRGQAVEILFPVKFRNIFGVNLLSPYLLARTAKLDRLAGISSIMGCEGIVSDGAGKPVPVEDGFAQSLIAETRERAKEQCQGIRRGSYVRILVGSHRMLCGQVAERRGDSAVVKIRLMSRAVRVTIPVVSLLNCGLDKIPYYYRD